MSCQQASRFITTTSNVNAASISISHSTSNNLTRVVNADDPYVFTESVPTTPPILFNTQKSRSRLSDIVSLPTSISFGNVPQQRVSLTNGTIAEITSQANPSTKNVTNQPLTTTAGTTQNKKATNVCIVRPQLQQQQQQQQQTPPPPPQQQQQHSHVISSPPCLERELKSISPPPLYTPTPSLWQTPLLIESASTKPTLSPATSIAPLPPTPTLGVTLGGNVCALPPGVCSSSSPALSSTTAMAKVAPIVVHSTTPLSPPASCLPPSKFHSHTMAQHLQKVECLKKPKKSVQPLSQFCTDDLERSESVDKTFVESLDSEQSLKLEKNSANEAVNDIPVNVIFRMAMVTQPSHQPQMDTNHTTKSKDETLTPAVKNDSTVSSPEPSLSLSLPCQAKSNGNRDASVTTTSPPASKVNHIARTQHEINPSSMQQRSQHQQIHCNSNQYETPVQQSMPQEEDQSASQPLRKTKVTNSKPRKSTNTNQHFEPPDHSTVDCITPKGSVAIIKLSHRITEASERDISHLATPAGLPYCLQNHWFTTYDIRNRLVASGKGKLNRSLLREERINLYKQQLRRQAIQLLSTKSLQRLPLQLARKRLVCVDRLIRKYNKQSNIGLPANVKRCIVNECKAFSLEMTSYCQQHIALNTGQAIFLECTAKFADNTQCRVPVFDIRHDLPLCLEHARKRDAYNRLSCEPKPRKNLASNGQLIASVSYCATMGKAIRAKQPSQPANNKRVTSGNPQAPGRKRKTTGNPVGRPQKRTKKCSEGNVASVVPCLISAGLKRKNSTTSLESLTSNSQHSSTSSTSHFTNQKQFNSITATSTRPTTNTSGINSLSPPALIPFSTGIMSQSLPRHLFSFGNDNNNINVNVRKHSIATHTIELKDFASNVTSASHIISQPSYGTQANIESTDANFINTNSNSNFTSSGMGSTTSIPSADDFLTQDMLSICENSSASSVDTGLGGLSDPEFMLGAHDGDDIPLGDTHLLEEQDLACVLNSLPEDAFKELFSAVHPDESDEIERAIELADKHLKTLQQTISTNDLLGDFLNFSDDMLLDHGEICISAGTAPSNQMIDTSTVYLAGGTVTNVSANSN